MRILMQKADLLTHQHHQSQHIYKLLKKNLISNEYAENQFIQVSKIPTMYFQNSLPRLPIPKLELTCERYLAAQKPLLIDEAYRKTESNVNRFKAGPGKVLQEALKSYDKQNKSSSYISQFWFHEYLKDRKPLPLNYNPMLVMHNDERQEYNNQLIRTTNLIISSLRFYKSLKADILEPEVFHLNPKKSDTENFRNICSMLPNPVAWYGAYFFKAYPLDMSQYHSLFNTTRIPEIDKDRICRNPAGKHITIQHKGHFYALKVISPEGDILPVNQIHAGLKFILNDDVPKCDYPVGILTTLERNKWATIRHNLAENGNDSSLKLIDSALFNVCVDSENVGTDPYAVTRNFLHGSGENRWFDKSISLQVSQDGVAAVNFEHAWGDGVAVLRFVQDIYKDSIDNPRVHPSTKADGPIENVFRLDMKLNDGIKQAITEAKTDYAKTTNSIDIDYLIFDRIGKNACKKQALSPDAIMQLGFQVAYHKMTGKMVPTYESCSTAAFKHGRTETVRPCTIATKAFTLAVNSSNNTASVQEMKQMVAECSRAHSQLTREAAMGQGFDRHLFALKKFAEKKSMLCNIFDDPEYAYLNHIILSTSTLSSPAVYAGGFGPVVREGLGVGYIIKDDSLGVLVTSYPPYQNGSDFIQALRESYDDILNIILKD